MEELPRGQYQRPRSLGRRGLLAGMVRLAQACAALAVSIPLVRFLAAPILGLSGQTARWVRLASSQTVTGAEPMPLRYEERVLEGYRTTTRTGVVFVRREPGGLVGTSAVCTHLGCTVRWDAGRDAFACPCHGGAFARDGRVVAGPPPRPLDPVPLKEEGGAIWARLG